jgi:hypothetical protein
MTGIQMRMFPDRNPPAKAEPAPVVEEVKVEAPVEKPVKETAAAKIKRKITHKE